MGGMCVITVLTFIDVGIGRFCSRCIFKYFIYLVVSYDVYLASMYSINLCVGSVNIFSCLIKKISVLNYFEETVVFR